MKFVQTTYQCDYCKQPIDTDSDTVCVLHPCRVGYQDSLIPDPEDSVHHYHDYCMEFLLNRTYQQDHPKNELAEAEQDMKEAVFSERSGDCLPFDEPKPGLVEEPSKKKAEKELGASDFADTTFWKKKGRKDLPALKALLDADWTQKKCADEFGVAESTICNWRKEIDAMINNGTWDDYCEERRLK